MSARLDRWFDVERRLYGKAEYFFKEDCLSSKIIAFYARAFNPTYISRYTTVRYPHTYFPGSEIPGNDEMLGTEFHENVHKWDRWFHGLRFNLGYLFPQIVAVPFFLAAVALSGPIGWASFAAFFILLHVGLIVLEASSRKHERAYSMPSPSARIAFYVLAGVGVVALLAGTIIGGGYFSLLWLGAVLFASPWPIKAKWRRDAEIRGYVATLYWEWLRSGGWDEGRANMLIDSIVKVFTGPAYFYMERDATFVEQELRWQISRFCGDEELFLAAWRTHYAPDRPNADKARPYRMMLEFVRQEGLVDA